MSEIMTIPQNIIISDQEKIIAFGQAANQAAEKAIFNLYQDRRPENTQRSQRATLKLFADFMRAGGIVVADLYSDPFAWMGITWALVQGFQKWLFHNGYSIKTINDRVSAVRVYMLLANQAGVIPDSDILRLQGLRSFTRKEAIDADEKRTSQGMLIRRGVKKSAAAMITDEQAQALCKTRNAKPQARRDALMMCLLLDHGMRVSEIARIEISNLDIPAHQINFYRQKTGKTSRHNLRGRTWRSLIEYLSIDQAEQGGPLLLASNKSGALIKGRGLTTRAIRERVCYLGRTVGIHNLSPHDCRHYGATKAGHDPNVSLAGLMAWGGWESPHSAAKYINRGQAENDGVLLGMG